MKNVMNLERLGGRNVLLFEEMMLAYKIIPFSVPVATVKFKINSKVTRAMPPMIELAIIPTVISGQSLGQDTHLELPKDKL